MTEYEQILLGAILNGTQALPELARILDGEDFYEPKHEVIFRAAVAVHRTGMKVTPMTVADKLGASLMKVGGPPYLHTLMAGWAADDPLFLADKVREARIRRDIAGMARKMAQIEQDLDVEPDRAVALIREWTDNIGTVTKPEVSDVSQAMERLVDIAQNGNAAAIPTPWSDLNRLIDGWYPGQLITIGARPGVGKSIFLENASTAAARMNRRVLFCSLEMGTVEILQRTMAHTARVELRNLRRGGKQNLTEQDWERINAAYPTVAGAPVDYADNKRQTMDSIRAAAHEAARIARRDGQPFGLIVVDYLQLVTPRDNRITRQQQVGEISRGLKQLAGEFDVPVLAGAQLSRAGAQRKDGIPILSDLREAGDIEQDSDVVIFLHEEEVEDSGRMIKTGDLDVIVAKQRSGPLGTVTLKKVGHYARIAS